MLIILDIKSGIPYYPSNLIREDQEMPYREKTAWLSLFAMIVTFGPYFIYVARDSRPPRPLPDLHELSYYAAITIAELIILGIGHLILRLKSPQEARIPLDERDEAIKRRSLASAYYVLIFGMIQVGCIMPFMFKGWSLVHAAIFMIVVAEIIRLSVTVVSYRRQA
jgi:hypothetical protein